MKDEEKFRRARLAFLVLCHLAFVIGGSVAGALLLVEGTHAFGFLIGTAVSMGLVVLIAAACLRLQKAVGLLTDAEGRTAE